jgi:hypothetical protein
MSALVVMGWLMLVFWLALGGPRRDKGNWKDPLAALGRPDGLFGHHLVACLACYSLLESPIAQPLALGLLIGVVVAATVRWNYGRDLLDLAGVAAALFVAGRFLGVGSAEGFSAFRLSLMALVLACFTLGCVFAVRMGRSVRNFVFNKGRGLSFFAVVELAVFFSGPLGADLLQLDSAEFYRFLGATSLAAVLLGFLASQFTLYVLALLLALVSLAGGGSVAGEPGGIGFLFATSLAYLFVAGFVGKLGR